MGSLFSPQIEWGILTVAAVLFFLMSIADMLHLCGWIGHRSGICGGPSQVPIHGINKQFRKIVGELIDSGYRPVGAIWETMAFLPKFREYLFVHPERHGYVTVSNLCGDDIMFGCVVEFENGAILKTLNCSTESIEADDYVVKRIGECPVADLMRCHQDHEKKFLSRDGVPVACQTVEEILLSNRRVFLHPIERDTLISTIRMILLVKLCGVGVFAVPMGLGALVCLAMGNGPVFSMMALGAAIWVILTSLFFLVIPLALRLFGEGSDENDEALSQSPIIHWVNRLGPLGVVVLAASVWQFGIKPVAIATLVLFSLIQLAEFSRLLLVSFRKDPDVTSQ